MRDVESVNLAPPSNLRFLLGGAFSLREKETEETKESALGSSYKKDSSPVPRARGSLTEEERPGGARKRKKITEEKPR